MRKSKFTAIVVLAFILLFPVWVQADDDDSKGLRKKVRKLQKQIDVLSDQLSELSFSEALWANVHTDGILTAGNGVVSVIKSFEFGGTIYTIDFIQDISLCAVTSSLSSRFERVSLSGTSVVVTFEGTPRSTFGVAVHCGGSFANLPPITGVVSLSPVGNVTALDVLTCSATGSLNSDGDPVENHSFAFKSNSNQILRGGQTSASIRVNQAFRPGDTVGCEGRANLGNPLPMRGEWVASPEQVTVLNTPPTLTSVNVSIGNPLIRCLPQASDPDFGDFLSVMVQWYVNGTLSSTDNFIFKGTHANTGDTVACELKMSDRFGGTSAWVRSQDRIVP